MKLRKQICVLMVLLSSLGFQTVQAEVVPSVDQLIGETQKQSPGERDLAIVWWLPEVFWELSLSSGGIKDEEVEEILKLVRPYTIFAVADGKLGPLGGVTFTPEEEVRKSVRLVDQRGTMFTPLSEEDVSPDIINLVNAMKPGIASAAGPIGENMNFYFFPSKNAFDEWIADPYEVGTFKVLVTGESFDWELPLSSVLAPKICPEDRKSMSGAWAYCPWHGKLLEASPTVEPSSSEVEESMDDNVAPKETPEEEDTERPAEVQSSSEVVEGP